MSIKWIIVFGVISLLILIVAVYNRTIDIDAVFRRHEKTMHPPNIVVKDLSSHFTYGSNGGFIINGISLRVYSSSIPPVVIRLNITADGKQVVVSDSNGKQFELGEIKNTQSRDNELFYTIGFEATDQTAYKSSFSVIPYYYGFFILSPGPLFRYYHYHSFTVKKKSGALLLIEWKFSTYRGKDGKLVPDLFGDNKEGLMKVSISNPD